MKTVHVVVPPGLDDPGRPSGGNTYDRRVCGGLAALGWTVHEHPVAGTWPHPTSADLEALRELLARIPDGVPVLVDGLIASVAAEPLAAAGARMPVVALVHMPLGAQVGEGAVLRSAAAVVTTSRWTRQRLLAEHRLDPDLVHVALPGVEPADLATGHPTGGSLLCVAAVAAHKGHDLLLSALAGLSAADWHLTCVGALDLQPEFVQRLRRQVADYGLTGRVSFAGPRTGPTLEEAYAAADVLVSASRTESYGMVVTEALARGLPVIATRVGGHPEALGRTTRGVLPGLLVAPDDAAALSEALGRWLGDPVLRSSLRVAAAERRGSLTGWSATAAEVSRVLRQVA
ncbi:glycosyltransferase family 4 protein [Nocardioides sp.]|uniref:glycosyltransferase family 4 protein n=1 Tax=Nocardioides sp. TaxID=35761 RepID=UPI003D0F62CA